MTLSLSRQTEQTVRGTCYCLFVWKAAFLAGRLAAAAAHFGVTALTYFEADSNIDFDKWLGYFTAALQGIGEFVCISCHLLPCLFIV